jgi:hypothetical protein
VFSLFSSFALRTLATRELPSFSAALLLAELFFKFHSFTLECVAFLSTWYALSWIVNRVWRESGSKERGVV